jgi:hypothetical protein
MSRSLIHRVSRLVLVAALSCGSVGSALAAPGDVLFEDDFAAVDAAFGEASDFVNVENNQLVNTLEPNQWGRFLYESMLFDDVDAAVTVQFDNMGSEDAAAVGLMFWAASVDECYILEIAADGAFAVRRFFDNRYLTALPFRASEAINTQPGASNELRVVTVGNHATLYINGQQVASFQGRVPEGGSLVGLYTESFEQPVVARFAELKVTEPAAPTSSIPASDPAVILADDFTSLHPRWGIETEWLRIVDGRLAVEFNPQETYTNLTALETIEGDFDAAATVSISAEPGAATSVASAAIAFWAKDNSDYYTFSVYHDGTIGVHRRVNNRWLNPLKVQAAPAGANVDVAAGVELRVVTSGRKATLYVNGVAVGTITGQPPQGESLVGLYGQSGDAASISMFDELTVRRP